MRCARVKEREYERAFPVAIVRRMNNIMRVAAAMGKRPLNLPSSAIYIYCLSSFEKKLLIKTFFIVHCSSSITGECTVRRIYGAAYANGNRERVFAQFCATLFRSAAAAIA